ncbi:MAG: AAA family ATPase [Bacteroidales bacterium]|nr:AAA family ATPase [Bacteroidales bacterium]MCF8404423.1 AAA family ATPase [Bacteroidales bacterium]
MIQDLLLHSRQIIDRADQKFVRYLMKNINWENRLIAIKGARGSGKTTLILQYIATNLPADNTVLYISLEDLYFYDNTLLSLAEEFVLNGGKYLFLDEVHKYPDWAREIKLIYDTYNQLQIVFTSSSLLEIQKAKYDLSRRAVEYHLNELSLREYLAIITGIELPVLNLEDILKNNPDVYHEILSRVNPVFEFNQYIKLGAYPYFNEGEKEYHQKLINTLNLVIENDLPSIYKLDFSMVFKIKRLLFAIATSVPFKPNVSKLSERIGVSRPTLLLLLDYLEKAEIIYQLKTDSLGLSSMSKPEKIYLHNTNLLYVLSKQNFEVGNIRETFFLNQASAFNEVNYSNNTDFIVNAKLYFEIGGRNKQQFQISGLKQAYIVKDNIEKGMLNVLPLWIFGFLY